MALGTNSCSSFLVQVRFPDSNNRRSDSGFGSSGSSSGVGEISLVTGSERKRMTSLAGFNTGLNSLTQHDTDNRYQNRLVITRESKCNYGTTTNNYKIRKHLYNRPFSLLPPSQPTLLTHILHRDIERLYLQHRSTSRHGFWKCFYCLLINLRPLPV